MDYADQQQDAVRAHQAAVLDLVKAQEMIEELQEKLASAGIKEVDDTPEIEEPTCRYSPVTNRALEMLRG